MFIPELTSVRLLDEIQTAGYRGSCTQLKEFVRWGYVQRRRQRDRTV
jgi:hypothetical protein